MALEHAPDVADSRSRVLPHHFARAERSERSHSAHRRISLRSPRSQRHASWPALLADDGVAAEILTHVESPNPLFMQDGISQLAAHPFVSRCTIVVWMLPTSMMMKLHLPFTVGLLALVGCGGSPPSGAGTGGSGGTSASTASGSGGGVSSSTGSPSSSSSSTTGSGGNANGTGISAKYPNDQNIASDPSVIFHSDFENDFTGWTWKQLVTVVNDPATANGGSKLMQAKVTRTDLKANPYISAAAQFEFPNRVPVVYWRYHTRFVGDTAVPHHGVRVAAGDANYQSDGLAGVVPPGDQGFWFDLDARDDGSFSFYAYWHQMRSWVCNDGSTTPGCAGYQAPGSSPTHYGNNFNPKDQTPFPRDQWFCVEMRASANTVGQSDGSVALWIDDKLVGEYAPGMPHGRWLRDNFYTWGQYYMDEGPFEGFDFRTSGEVAFKRVTLDTYYQKDTLDQKEAGGVKVPEEQIILFDDVVVATERIGCKVK
ncbi:Hypothetical protein A7982_02203 [Minicystis rosea]|nr:Hypothetical protein A7982_02203 [Minicystis rosea]